MLETVRPRWQSCIVAAPGPSLSSSVDEACSSGLPTIVVNDAWRAMPWADVLYACDNTWWEHHQGTGFRGEKWSTHEGHAKEQHANDKREIHAKWGVKCVRGADGEGFSLDPTLIHYGSNSGFQALNLAILFGCKHIILIGYDMRRVDGKGHFFGEHPPNLGRGTDYERFVKYYDRAKVPEGIRIVNATPGSALKCYPVMSLTDALEDNHLHCHGAVAHAAAG